MSAAKQAMLAFLGACKDGGMHPAELKAAMAEVFGVSAQWLPVSTRPFGSKGTYLVANCHTGHVAPWIRGVIHNNPGTANEWHYGESITHWMHLPPPPLPQDSEQQP